MHDVQVELYIDCGQEPEAMFDKLMASKDAIETQFGGSLEWQRLEEKRACRIRKVLEVGGYRADEAKWPEVQDAMIDAMVRLQAAHTQAVARDSEGIPFCRLRRPGDNPRL
jgi:hypothetical protein